MYKNNNTYTIVYEEGTIEILLQKYLEGAQVVFVVQKSGVLLGGVTRGDIRRLYKNNKTVISFMEIVNTNIKRITFIDEEQVFKDAKEVFDHNNKIHNIPVVNKTGKILFQIDRFAENIFVSQDIRNILDAAKGGAIECFFESDDIKEIILTGSDRESLYKTEQIFYQYCNELILKKNNVTVIMLVRVTWDYIDMYSKRTPFIFGSRLNYPSLLLSLIFFPFTVQSSSPSCSAL